MVFAYFAPEVMLPVASVLAGVFGFIMLVARTPFRIAARGVRAAVRGSRKILDKLNM